MNFLTQYAVLAQVDPAAVASLIALGPSGIAALAIAGAVWLLIKNQSLHAEHVELLRQTLPVSLKLAEAVNCLDRTIERLERRLDTSKP
jgi:hypothetical protein